MEKIWLGILAVVVFSLGVAFFLSPKFNFASQNFQINGTEVEEREKISALDFFMSRNSGNISFIGSPKLWHCGDVLILKKPIENPAFEAFLRSNISYFERFWNEISPIPVEFSCRKDVGICFEDGKICFSRAFKDPRGNIVELHARSCSSQEEVNSKICSLPNLTWFYFTGIGCPHCARVDPVLFYLFVPQHPEVLLVEYEIYREARNNVPVFRRYLQEFYFPEDRIRYGGVPHLRTENATIVGDTPILTFLNILKK